MKKSEIHHQFKVSHGSISNLANLAKALSLDLVDFEKLWKIPETDRYKQKKIPKSSGGERTVYIPCKEVRLIQQRINTRIFSNPNIIKWPPFLYGSIPSSTNKNDVNHSRDYVSCARLHCGAKSILKMDIKDFFDNINENIVLSIFTDVLKFPEEVSEYLTRACIHNSSLVQGALTSSYIAMLSLHNLEQDAVNRLRRKDLIYTRFVDDITVSSKISNYDFSYAQRVIEDMLTKAELPVNTKKTTIQHTSSSPLTVHGLRVSFKEPRLPATEIRNIRAAVQSLEIVSKEGFFRQSFAYRKSFNKCMGRVNKLSRVKHPQHKKLAGRLSKIRPQPSPKEVKYAISATAWLTSKHPKDASSYFYKKHFYRISERINIIKTLYPSLARDLRNQLKKIQPDTN